MCFFGFSSIPGLPTAAAVSDIFSPLNCTLALCVCFYSFAVNYSFGHPSYWRKKSALSRLSPANSSSNLMCTKPSTCDASKLLEEANRDVVVHILGFLSAFELTVIGQVSRKYQSIAQSQQLWSDLRLPRSETEAATPPSSSCKVDGPNTGRLAFFQALRCAYDSVLGDESRLVVRLHGALYDLSLFLNEHPGGEGLLLEYRARDATVMYERVSHSPLAREIAEHFVVFRTSDYTGRKGWPAFAKHPSVSETQS